MLVEIRALVSSDNDLLAKDTRDHSEVTEIFSVSTGVCATQVCISISFFLPMHLGSVYFTVW